jgi:hypothetical protein
MPDELASRPFEEPAASRLALDDPNRAAILAAHQQAMLSGSDGYIDPVTGLMALTAAYLARQGTCCDSGCRHCPYGQD